MRLQSAYRNRLLTYIAALSIRIYYSRKVSPVIEKNFWKRWKKVAQTEGTLSAVLWSVLAVFWVSFALSYAVFHIEVLKKLAVPFPIWLRRMGIGLGISLS